MRILLFRILLKRQPAVVDARATEGRLHEFLEEVAELGARSGSSLTPSLADRG